MLLFYIVYLLFLSRNSVLTLELRTDNLKQQIGLSNIVNISNQLEQNNNSNEGKIKETNLEENETNDNNLIKDNMENNKGTNFELVEKASGSVKEISVDVTSFDEKKRIPVKLNIKQGLIMNQILGIYALSDVSNQLCHNHTAEFHIGLRAFEPWALKMFDSSSKLQSGVLFGNLMEFGSFQQCIHIYENTQFGPIRGKHCTIKITPTVDLIRKILEFRNITRQRFTKVYTFVKNAALVWALCIPDSCNSQDVLHHFEKIFVTLSDGLQLNISITDSDCSTIHDQVGLSNDELIILICFGTYFSIIIVFTIVDIYSTREEVAENKLVNIFSAYGNSKQIFAKGKEGSSLECVNGIRFLSTCYVVIGHRYLMMMFFPVINSLHILDWVVYYRSTVITGGTLCVDTFFMISGMLVSLGFFSHVSKVGKMNWTAFYVGRYLRITPPLGVVVLIYCKLMQHLGSGPLWNDMLSVIQKPCQEYWWATLLHIQNYVHPFPLCMTQAWYLTCDMQYYFLSPIILIPLWRWPILGYINYSIVYILSIAINFYLAWINKYDGGVPITNQLFSTKYFQHHYIAPHTRAATYIIGLGLGYTIFKTKNTKVQLNYAFAVFCWVTSIIVLVVSLVGCHVFHLASHDYNRLEASIFLSLSRSSWTLGIVWMVWACIHGYGGPINYVLSLHIFRVLGKISYGIYLLHMLLQYAMSGANKLPLYFSDFSSIYAGFSDLFIVVVLGFLFTVCFESPIIKALEYAMKSGSNKINPHNEKK